MSNAWNYVKARRIWFAGLILLQAGAYLALAVLSRQFEWNIPRHDRPILWAVGLLALAFVLHLLSLVAALRIESSRTTTAVVFVGAVLFRVILLGSQPIQEVDFYRYLWDGAATSAGVNPYHFSPRQVLAASQGEAQTAELTRLVELRSRSATDYEILRRVHFGELTTVYPPVSQAVFAFCRMVVPSRFGIEVHVAFLKLVLIGFDLATLICMLGILKIVGLHPAWSIVYGWSPLVLKEIANSAHLDSIAIFSTTLALWCLVQGVNHAGPSQRQRWFLASSFVLGIAIGAKLYPLALLPIFLAVIAKHGDKLAVARAALCCIAISTLCVGPMLLSAPAETRSAATPPVPISAGDATTSHEHSAAMQTSTDVPQRGLSAFLSRWEINDVLFLACVENLKPPDAAGPDPLVAGRHWFVIAPPSWRERLIGCLAKQTGINEASTAFLLARVFTLTVWLGVAMYWARRAYSAESLSQILEATFLTLAWFWALSPTMNPWYWIWAMPLLPFARGRAWFAVSGLVLLYYTRYWLTDSSYEISLPGVTYFGEGLFHYLLVFVEHGIWMAWLFGAWFLRRRMYPVSQTPT